MYPFSLYVRTYALWLELGEDVSPDTQTRYEEEEVKELLFFSGITRNNRRDKMISVECGDEWVYIFGIS